MGLLVEGVWQAQDPRPAGAAFQRPEAPFRDWVTADGSSGFRAEPDRYVLFVNRGCPWAFRTLLYRALKQLEGAIELAVTLPAMGPEGWQFGEGPRCTPDPILGASHLHELYTAARSDYTGRVTVPVLWDRETSTIVNNESADLIRMLGREFDAFGDPGPDYLPEDLRPEIDAWNERIYHAVNNGVYRCGFAGSQAAYEEAFEALFAMLDELDQRLASRRFLFGDRITETDWRLFATLVRFDAAYVSVFRCNRRRLVDYEHLWPYTRDLYQQPRVAATVDLDHIKRIYWSAVPNRAGVGLIPAGPDLAFDAAHDRAALAA